MLETINLVLTQFTNEAIVVSSLILFSCFTSIILYWLCSKKKSKGHPHQLPASVVGNYMDNAMANAESLNSYITSEGKASVVSPGKLKAGAGTQEVSIEEFNQKLAELASLKHSIKDLQGQVKDFQKKLSGQSNQGGFSIAQAMREKLTNLVKVSGSKSDTKLEKKLVKANEEKEEYKKKLKEYEVISDDIANVEKMKKENKELKQTLEGEEKEDSQLTLVKDTPPQKEEIIRVKGEDNEKPDNEIKINQSSTDADKQKNESDNTAQTSAQNDSAPNDGEQKTTEDLLNEFEKMLG